jgi:hypothetical protein
MQSLIWGKSNTSLSNCLFIFKDGGGCIMVWVCLTLANTQVFEDQKKQAKY